MEARRRASPASGAGIIQEALGATFRSHSSGFAAEVAAERGRLSGRLMLEEIAFLGVEE